MTTLYCDLDDGAIHIEEDGKMAEKPWEMQGEDFAQAILDAVNRAEPYSQTTHERAIARAAQRKLMQHLHSQAIYHDGVDPDGNGYLEKVEIPGCIWRALMREVCGE